MSKFGLLKSFRSKHNELPQDGQPKVNGYVISAPFPSSYASRLDRKILNRIFGFICPQTLDTSYQTLDDVDLEVDCMLCNLRDLAHCARVCKAWQNPAMELLCVISFFLPN
jgi:hypothetical protein